MVAPDIKFMKTANAKVIAQPLGKSSLQQKVDAEVAAIGEAFKKINRNQETARAFLVKAGIITAKGNLTKRYR